MLVGEARLSPFWAWMLWAAAAFNIIVAAPSLFIEATPDQDRIVAVLVAAFGALYALVARHPSQLGVVLWAGIIGKLGVLAILIPAVQEGRQPMGIAPILAGDALFTLAFLAFLMRRFLGQRGSL